MNPELLMKKECAIRWRLSRNKIVEHQCFLDTASMLLQLGQLTKE